MHNYFEFYTYDEVGNILLFDHKADNGNWIRNYKYNEDSLIETGRKSNRLSATTVSGATANYKYDEHGNMTRMPHFADHADPGQPNMNWDSMDKLQMVDKGNGCKVYYVYDAADQRVRKVIEQNGAPKEERIYFEGFEVYHKYNGSNTLERETLHVMDDKQRIALVEMRTLDTAGDDPAPQQLIRYQLGNHLGSASLELNESANIISYEEYYPYGSTSYQAVDKSIKADAKRYRYTGKERDEETGFTYHGARYYAPWMGRWMSCDPAGLVDGTNLYKYASNSPASLHDPTGNESEPFQLHTPSLLSPNSAQEQMAARYAGSLVPPLRLGSPPNLSLPGAWTPSSSSTSTQPASPPDASAIPAPTASAGGDAASGASPHFSGSVFPPRLQLDWGHFLGKADTSSASVRLSLGNGNLTAAYAYGGDLARDDRRGYGLLESGQWVDDISR
jgi:RHS repeat-associated protein